MPRIAQLNGSGGKESYGSEWEEFGLYFYMNGYYFSFRIENIDISYLMRNKKYIKYFKDSSFWIKDSTVLHVRFYIPYTLEREFGEFVVRYASNSLSNALLWRYLISLLKYYHAENIVWT
jgi:hypothetical protein